MLKERENRLEILELLERTYSRDFLIGKVARQVKIARSTTFTWLKTEEKIKVLRRAILFTDLNRR